MTAEENKASGAGVSTRAATPEAERRKVVLDLLKSELEVAGTFISAAETTANAETAVRNITNAWVALKTAVDLAEQLPLDSDERRAFRDGYGALCLRLADLQLRSHE
jgi:hypothetical protein